MEVSNKIPRNSTFYGAGNNNGATGKLNLNQSLTTKTIYIPTGGFDLSNDSIVMDMDLEKSMPIMDFLISICSQYQLTPFSEYCVSAPTGVNGALEICKSSAKVGSLILDGDPDQNLVPFLKICSRKSCITNAQAKEAASRLKNIVKSADGSSSSNSSPFTERALNLFGTASSNKFMPPKNWFHTPTNSRHGSGGGVENDEGGGCSRSLLRYDSFAADEFYVSRLAKDSTYFPTKNTVMSNFTGTSKLMGTSEVNCSLRQQLPSQSSPASRVKIPFEITQRIMITLLPVSTRKKYVIRGSASEKLEILMKRLTQEYPNLGSFTKTATQAGEPTQEAYEFAGPLDQDSHPDYSGLYRATNYDMIGIEGKEYAILNRELSLNDYPTLLKESHLYLMPTTSIMTTNTQRMIYDGVNRMRGPKHQTLPLADSTDHSSPTDCFHITKSKYPTMPNPSSMIISQDKSTDSVSLQSLSRESHRSTCSMNSNSTGGRGGGSSSVSSGQLIPNKKCPTRSPPPETGVTDVQSNKQFELAGNYSAIISGSGLTNSEQHPESTNFVKVSVEGGNEPKCVLRKKAPLPPIPYKEFKNNVLPDTENEDQVLVDSSQVLLANQWRRKWEGHDDDKSNTSSGYHGSSNSPSPCNTQTLAESRKARKKSSAPKPPQKNIRDSVALTSPVVTSKDEGGKLIETGFPPRSNYPDENEIDDVIKSLVTFTSTDSSVLVKNDYDSSTKTEQGSIKSGTQFYDTIMKSGSIRGNDIRSGYGGEAEEEEIYINGPQNGAIGENIYENVEETFNKSWEDHDIMRGSAEQNDNSEDVLIQEQISRINLEDSFITYRSTTPSPSIDSVIYSQVIRKYASPVCNEREFLANDTTAHHHLEMDKEINLMKEDRDIAYSPPVQESTTQTTSPSSKICEVEKTGEKFCQARISKTAQISATKTSCAKNDKGLVVATKHEKTKRPLIKTLATTFKFRTSDSSDVVRNNTRDRSSGTENKAIVCQNTSTNFTKTPSSLISNHSSSMTESQTNKEIPAILDKNRERPWTINTFFKSSNSTAAPNTENLKNSELMEPKKRHDYHQQYYRPEERFKPTANSRNRKASEILVDTNFQQVTVNDCETENEAVTTDCKLAETDDGCGRSLSPPQNMTINGPSPSPSSPKVEQEGVLYNSKSHPVDIFDSPSFKSSLYSKFNNIQTSVNISSSSSASSSSMGTEVEEDSAWWIEEDEKVTGKGEVPPNASVALPNCSPINSRGYEYSDEVTSKTSITNGIDKSLSRETLTPLVKDELLLKPDCRDLLMLQIRNCGGKGMLKRSSTVKRETCTIFQTLKSNNVTMIGQQHRSTAQV